MTGTRCATLEVAGMTCTDCEQHAAVALERAGAEQVSAGFRRGVARFAWPGGEAGAGLRAAVTQAGYTPGTRQVAHTGDGVQKKARGVPMFFVKPSGCWR
jgi:hypothetical protein